MCACAKSAICCRNFCSAATGGSVFCEGLHPSHNFLLGVCWSLPLKARQLTFLVLCFGGMKHHTVIIIMIMNDQTENVPHPFALTWTGRLWWPEVALLAAPCRERDAGPSYCITWIFTPLPPKSLVCSPVCGLFAWQAQKKAQTVPTIETPEAVLQGFTALTQGSCQPCSSCSPKATFSFLLFPP